MQENLFQDRGTHGHCVNHGNYAEITRKLGGKFQFRIRNYSTKFPIKVMKPHFKMRKALFKRGLERNCKNKYVLEFDEEKNCRIFLEY